ncbi:MAG: hypothetical protein ABJM26_15685 [Anderseniella sp.]|uniref:hypothetical protein n=1 Tax=Parasphingorhabdus sp. TaxID=2709688 RepID=UPI003293D2EF
MNITSKMTDCSFAKSRAATGQPKSITSFFAACALASLFIPIFAPVPTYSFAGISDNVACANFIETPQGFARHRDGVVTYRISQNFKARYPDVFSQYLVRDTARWWQDYISGFLWSDDISSRFSYYRKDTSEPVYELKSILAHEFGHAMGMQHSDACFYNTNDNTGAPWNSNFRTAGGGAFSIEPTLGPEILNEVPTASSPGQKAEGQIDGYFRTPGRDAFEFMNSAYPFQSLSLMEVQSGTPDILVDSTDAAPAGGQTSYPGGFTNIVPGSDADGWFFDGINIWVGNNIGMKNRSEAWMIENFTGFELRQITLRVNGTSTRRAISETAPPFFTNFGVGLTSSPEQLIFSWSTPPGGPWPPTASGLLTLDIDVHDWTVEEALIWANSNQAFPLLVSTFVAQKPWGLASPNDVPPGLAPKFNVAANVLSEPTPVPDSIELIPPITKPNPTGVRSFTAMLPALDDTEIERFELLPIDWAQAELLVHLSPDQRNRILAQRFDSERDGIVDLAYGMDKKKTGKATPASLGFLPDPNHKIRSGNDGTESRHHVRLSRKVEISLSDKQTYAVRLIAANKHARVTSISIPEHTTYQGTRMARCESASDVASCCPVEMGRPAIRIAGRASTGRSWHWSAGSLVAPRCIVGNDRDDWIQLSGKVPHFLASGAGNDWVHASKAGSVVLLGPGNDAFSATKEAVAHVRGGDGDDRISTSNVNDQIEGGKGNDVVLAHAGNDLVLAGPGDDFIDAGPGNDRIYPGSGKDYVIAGPGNDRVIYSHICELRKNAVLLGGEGRDVLILPVSKEIAENLGLKYYGFERVIENAARASMFSDCE